MSSREIGFLPGSRAGSRPEQGVESPHDSRSHALGVSAELAQARRARHRAPLPRPVHGRAERARRQRRAGEVADRLGQDARVRAADRRAARRERGAGRARARADARARRAGDRGARDAAPGPRPHGRDRLRRRPTPRPGQRARRSARPRRHARPAAGSGRPRGWSRSTAIRILVLDEADRMLDMGFKPQVDRIVRACRATGRRCSSRPRSTARSASWRARTRTRPPASRPSCRPAPQGEVEHRFVPVTADTKVDTLDRAARGRARLALVFVRTKRGADRLAAKLVRRGVQAVAMHGDLTQRARERALKRFEAGEVSTLIATDVAAARPRPRGHHARRQLRPARGRQGLRPPRRPHRPRRPRGHRRDARAARAAGRGQPGREAERPRRDSTRRPGCARRRPLVYSSRRRNSKWGPVRPRRKI